MKILLIVFTLLFMSNANPNQYYPLAKSTFISDEGQDTNYATDMFLILNRNSKTKSNILFSTDLSLACTMCLIEDDMNIDSNSVIHNAKLSIYIMSVSVCKDEGKCVITLRRNTLFSESDATWNTPDGINEWNGGEGTSGDAIATITINEEFTGWIEINMGDVLATRKLAYSLHLESQGLVVISSTREGAHIPGIRLPSCESFHVEPEVYDSYTWKYL